MSEHPALPANPPGRTEIAYRVGDFASFRGALLRALPGEQELASWRPGAGQDLALQMLEWWAYLADVLTFYNERSANEAYLRTAGRPESLDHLIRLLGYRPSPGIGAVGRLAVLLSGSGPVTIERGFQLQSKPGPGKKPQIFEVDVEKAIGLPDAVPVAPKPDHRMLTQTPNGEWSVLLAGTVTSVRRGDHVLLHPRVPGVPDNSTSSDRIWPTAWVEVSSVAAERDPLGAANTRIAFSKTFEPSSDLAGNAASAYRVRRSTLAARPWPYSHPTGFVVAWTEIALGSAARQLVVGDPVVIEAPGLTVAPNAVTVFTYSEQTWFANADGSDPNRPFEFAEVPPVPILIGKLHTSEIVGAETFDHYPTSTVVRFGWVDVGTPIATPTPDVVLDGSSVELVPRAGGTIPEAPAGHPCMVEDAAGAGVMASLSGQGNISLKGVTGSVLRQPLRGLFDLLAVSRGSTVPREVLGSGDAARAGQEFTLKKSPLTYLSNPPGAGGGYRSTLTVLVDDLRWQEVPSFYGQGPRARVFVTREHSDATTRVQFGDGVNGARLPSGLDNVVAAYRVGSGAETPEPGSLSVIVKPHPKVKAVRNPVGVGGGADPDPPERIRRYAPRSVLTFGRAVSADDYEAIAATAPGVDRARAYWAYDGGIQRATVVVYAGDAATAAEAAADALAAADDPNRPVVVKLAAVIAVRAKLTVVRHADRAPDPVVAAVQSALIDPTHGLFGLGRLRIGDAVFASSIYAACMGVPGVLAVHGLQLLAVTAGVDIGFGPRFSPGPGGVFRLDPDDLTIEQVTP